MTDGFKLRNYKSTQYDNRRNVSLEFRQHLEGIKSKTDAKHLGKQGIEGFRAFLKKQYGSYVAAWRALDTERRGALSFGEFCRACRTIGFQGHLKQLWKELDAKGNGAVTLSDLEPRTGHVVGLFQREVMNQYGSMQKAWMDFDPENNGWVCEDEMVKAVATLGLSDEIDGKELYRMLCVGPPKAGLRLLDFDPDAVRGVRSGTEKRRSA